MTASHAAQQRIWSLVDWKEIVGPLRPWLFETAFVAACASWMALMGPFGTYRVGLAERFALQLSLGACVVVLCGLAGRIAIRLGRDLGAPVWLSLPAGLLVASAPLSAAVALVVQHYLPAARQPAWLWYAQTVLILLPGGTVYSVLLHLFSGRLPAPTAKSQPLRLTARLPASLGRNILALEAEDHYVRVHTAKGSCLIHMRLADAIDEVDGLEGLRVHRSWWVARQGATAARLKGRPPRLSLVNGMEVPVARAAAGSLKDAGWALQKL